MIVSYHTSIDLCWALIDCCLTNCRELYWMTLGKQYLDSFLGTKCSSCLTTHIVCVRSTRLVQHYKLSMTRQGQLDPVDVQLQGPSLYSVCKRNTSQLKHVVHCATMSLQLWDVKSEFVLKDISGGNGRWSTLHCGIHIPYSVLWYIVTFGKLRRYSM